MGIFFLTNLKNISNIPPRSVPKIAFGRIIDKHDSEIVSLRIFSASSLDFP